MAGLAQQPVLTPLSPSKTRWRTVIARGTAHNVAIRRTLLLVFATTLMGIGDLLCTIIYMRGVGMIEVNPIARFMISVGGAKQLIIFKIFTLALSAGTIYLCRTYKCTERWAWVCALVMLALTFHWVYYNNTISSLTHEIVILATQSSDAPESWVKLGD